MRTDNKITRKQFLKRKTLVLAYMINKSIISEEEGEKLTMQVVIDTFPKVNYYKDNRTGEIRVGLSLRGIRKLVKKYPLITADQVKEYYGMGV